MGGGSSSGESMGGGMESPESGSTSPSSGQ